MPVARSSGSVIPSTVAAGTPSAFSKSLASSSVVNLSLWNCTKSLYSWLLTIWSTVIRLPRNKSRNWPISAELNPRLCRASFFVLSSLKAVRWTWRSWFNFLSISTLVTVFSLIYSWILVVFSCSLSLGSIRFIISCSVNKLGSKAVPVSAKLLSILWVPNQESISAGMACCSVSVKNSASIRFKLLAIPLFIKLGVGFVAEATSSASRTLTVEPRYLFICSSVGSKSCPNSAL